MKNNFAKKTIKILTIAFFGVFVLSLFNFATVYAKAAYSVEETTYSDGGYEVKKTTTIYEDENGKEITRVEEVPTDTNYGNGTVKESYTDNTGVEHTRNGFINKSGDYSWDSDNWYTTDETSGSITRNSTNSTNSTSGKKFTYTLLQPLPREGEDLQKNVTLKEYLTWAFRFTLALAGFLAVMMIVIGGVEWIISGANESSRSDAKKRINNAISGLVLALVSYLVLYTINPNLVDFENNSFFKAKETTSSGNNNGNSDTNTETGSSSSNVGDINRGVTDVKDLQFDFGNQ